MTLTLEVVGSMAKVPSADWDRLTSKRDPFTEHRFLHALETSGSVGSERSGWLPRHILARRDGLLVGALPLYLKLHSYGEFIFDFGWAQAAHRAGLEYYPKLVSAVPFTPATGARLLVLEGEDRGVVVPALVAAVRELAKVEQASSIHILFCSEGEAKELEALGMHHRLSSQYHLVCPDAWATFDDFAGALRNSARKQVRRERDRARGHGLAFSMRPFSELSEDDTRAMWSFYRRTIDNHGSQTYLTRAFFEGLKGHPHAYAAMAHDQAGAAAGALFFAKDDALYGRYWGARDELDMLHFELCYYLPLEWGLSRGLRHFEAGAQGEHKIKRGFLPSTCHSAHWATHQGLDKAIADFVVHEARYVLREMELLAQSTPFKRG